MHNQRRKSMTKISFNGIRMEVSNRFDFLAQKQLNFDDKNQNFKKKIVKFIRIFEILTKNHHKTVKLFKIYRQIVQKHDKNHQKNEKMSKVETFLQNSEERNRSKNGFRVWNNKFLPKKTRRSWNFSKKMIKTLCKMCKIYEKITSSSLCCDSQTFFEDSKWVIIFANNITFSPSSKKWLHSSQINFFSTISIEYLFKNLI